YVLGAAVVGFVGVTTLHSPSSSSVPVSSAGSSKSSGSTTTTAPAPASGSTTTTTLAGPSSNVNGTAVGQLENYSYGQLAVKVTISNNRIVDLKVTSLQTLESYSQQLEQQAVPLLKSEVLQAQGIRINAISGATYTSEAYAYSIQSALDKLHFK
ncbi:MAG: FMN-binding protein, partial [Acidobacteriaceae bacterium]